MRRLLLIFAAALAVGLPLGELAMARDGHGNGRGQGQGRGRIERQEPPRRGPPPREARRDDRPRYDAPRYESRRPDERRYDERPGRGPPVRSFREDGDRRGGRWDDDRPPPDARSARRGGYLPDAYRGGVVDDYQRYRLRAPPRGYAWVRVGGGFALVSLDDGRIFDMVQ
jgi:Ni/Co efflux regulator RcnB